VRRILLNFAHPAIHKSRVNQALLALAAKEDFITINDLYESYPDFTIDVKREQDLLLEHDIIVWQHPFYWYSAPAIVKEWCDLVLEYGFAYGKDGSALHGKSWSHIISAGGPSTSYSKSGRNRFSVRELLAPFDQTAHLCGMNFLPPFFTFETLSFSAGALPESVSRQYLQYLRALAGIQSTETYDLAREFVEAKI
jgi:glutathione-regulated potassium-efflux system ancillary protein KefG